MNATRDVLVYRLQELYSFYRDTLPVIDAAHYRAASDPLRALLERQLERTRGELESLERALNLLGARFKMEHSAVAQGVKEASGRFRAQTDPTTDQADIYAVLGLLRIASWVIGAYQGDIELARAVGEEDVAKVLEENQRLQQDSLDALRAFAPRLFTEISQREARKAA